MSMRIIAGERRGYKLEGPSHRQTRPTSDLVRESIFNILGEQVAGRVVVDLFAGTGALGFEALSRGAVHATFVERDRGNADVIRRNAAHLEFGDRITILCADAYRWIKHYVPVDDDGPLVLIDPPYPEYRDHQARLAPALASLMSRLPARGVIVLEGPDREMPPVLPDGIEWDVRRYGRTLIAIGIAVASPDADEGDPLSESDPDIMERHPGSEGGDA